MKSRILVVCAAVWAAVGQLSAVGQTPYAFTNIADTSGPFSTFGISSSINAYGTVAFHANLDAGGSGIFTGSGGPISTIVDTTGPLSTLGFPTINDAATVVFDATFDAGGTAIFIGKVGAITPVVDTTGPFRSVVAPSINNAGVVAFLGALDGIPLGHGIFTADGGSIAPIADTSGRFSFFGAPQINDSGVVVFGAELDTFGASGNYTGSGGPISTIVEAEGGGSVSLDLMPRISNNGIVAFAMSTRATSGITIFTGDGGPLTTIASNAGPFQALGASPDINSSGALAFGAMLDSGKMGIYTGGDPVLDQVIEIGDPLFGSTLIDLRGFPRINEQGDVVFEYILANGMHGIAVASIVPEPASIVLIGIALAGCRPEAAFMDVARFLRNLGIGPAIDSPT